MKQVFTIIPGSSGALWLAVGFTVLMLALAGLFIYIAISTRGVKFEVTQESLRITGDMFGRTIPLSSLDIDEMQALNLRQDRVYAPSSRRMGTGLPGYLAGWFRLRNGEKALLFVTDASQVVRIPTSDGYSLVISPQHRESFMEAMRAAAAY